MDDNEFHYIVNKVLTTVHYLYYMYSTCIVSFSKEELKGHFLLVFKRPPRATAELLVGPSVARGPRLCTTVLFMLNFMPGSSTFHSTFIANIDSVVSIDPVMINISF